MTAWIRFSNSANVTRLTNSSLALFAKICAWTDRLRHRRRIPVFRDNKTS
jgi:hypothetical protein